MNIPEWITNNREVNEEISPKDRGKEIIVKVKEHKWNTEDDSLGIKKPTLVKENLSVTKRNVLKQIASVFDPSGLLSPVILRGKSLIQDVWKQKLDWDDELGEQYLLKWKEIAKDLKRLDDFKLERYIASNDAIVNETEYVLVFFADASRRAYASTIYLVEKETDGKSDLVFAKSSIAPVKEMTIPKLELMAVGTRSIKFVRKELNLPIKNTFQMTDSSCVLQWTYLEKIRPIFIKNRIKEISCCKDTQFKFVNSKFNASDTASRGYDFQELSDNHM